MATHKPAVIISGTPQNLPAGDGLKDIQSIENGLIINDAGADVDFRVESTGYAGMFFVDAGSNAVQIGDGALGSIADFRATGIVFNEFGDPISFRVESANYPYALWVDAANDMVSLAGMAEFTYGDSINFYAPQVTFNANEAAANFRVAGETFSHMLFVDGTNLNIALLASSAPAWQGMERGLFIGDAASIPGTNPTDGVYLYASAGTLYLRTSSGPAVDLGNAGASPVNMATNHFRLGLVSNDPTADATNQSTLYSTPFVGNQIALYDGAKWALHSGSQFSLTLSGLTTNAVYDVFVYSNSGTLTLELGAAWTDANTRSTALAVQDGVYVKSGATTRRYVGTIRAVSATTTTSDTQLRYVYNFNNQAPLAVSFAATSTYTYSTATNRIAGNSDSAVRAVIGIANKTQLQIGASFFGSSTGNGQYTGGYRVDTSGVDVILIAGRHAVLSAQTTTAVYNNVPIAQVGVLQVQIYEIAFSGTITGNARGFEATLLI